MCTAHPLLPSNKYQPWISPYKQVRAGCIQCAATCLCTIPPHPHSKCSTMSSMSLEDGYKQAVTVAAVLCPAQNSQNNLVATAKASYPAIICVAINHNSHLYINNTPQGCTACSKRNSSTDAHTLPLYMCAAMALLPLPCQLAANGKTLGGLISCVTDTP